MDARDIAGNPGPLCELAVAHHRNNKFWRGRRLLRAALQVARGIERRDADIAATVAEYAMGCAAEAVAYLNSKRKMVQVEIGEPRLDWLPAELAWAKFSYFGVMAQAWLIVRRCRRDRVVPAVSGRAVRHLKRVIGRRLG